MKEKTRLGRNCKDCNKRFIPISKESRKCEKCKEKIRRKAIQKGKEKWKKTKKKQQANT